jgi:hypothetical protein
LSFTPIIVVNHKHLGTRAPRHAGTSAREHLDTRAEFARERAMTPPVEGDRAPAQIVQVAAV